MKFSLNKEQIIENTPKIEGFKCKFMVYALYFALTFLPLLVSLYVWYEYDWLLAIGAGLFLYLVNAIVVSKLRLSSLPRDQFERTFSSLEVAKWYIDRHHCY